MFEYLAVLYVISQGVDHRSWSSFRPEQVEFIQSLQSRLEDKQQPCEPSKSHQRTKYFDCRNMSPSSTYRLNRQIRLFPLSQVTTGGTTGITGHSTRTCWWRREKTPLYFTVMQLQNQETLTHEHDMQNLTRCVWNHDFFLSFNLNNKYGRIAPDDDDNRRIEA